MQIKPSDSNRSFDTGAQRGEDKGRGKPSLLPFVALRALWVQCFEHVHEMPWLAIVELSKVYEGGARKYKPRNWEIGIPAAAFVDSAHRHLQKFVRGDTDEPHCGQYVWNLMGLLATHIWVAQGRLPQTLFRPVFPLDADPDPKYTGLDYVDCEEQPTGRKYAFERGSASFHSNASWGCVANYLCGYGVDHLVGAVAHALCLLEHVTEFYNGGEPVDIPKVKKPESLEIVGPPIGGTYTLTNNATGEVEGPFRVGPPDLTHEELGVLAAHAAAEWTPEKEEAELMTPEETAAACLAGELETAVLDVFEAHDFGHDSFTLSQTVEWLRMDWTRFMEGVPDEAVEGALTRLVRKGKLGVVPGTVGPFKYERRAIRHQVKGGHEKVVVNG